MPIDNQDEAIEFVQSPGVVGAGAADQRMVVTLISIVVLAGARAFKLKRALTLPYLDFSTPERRLAACEQEFRLNARTAPGLYRAVHRITRERDGQLALDGEGVLVDAVLEMARFEQSGLFDQMALAGGLTAPLMTRLAQRIAAFHAGAAVARSGGGAAGMAAVLDLNRRSLQLAGVFSAAERERLGTALQAALDAHAGLLDARAASGRVRRCHGDLHLRNICLIDGEPTLFDCLEFNEALATVDVLYDLAFLLMDLWHRGLADLANIVFNRYLDQVDDQDGLALLPFFMALRAAIRAQVAAGQLTENDDGATGLAAEARAYFAQALDLLEPRPARLVAVGGLSGSGKSTVAAAIAPGIGPAPGARVLSSDRIRKRLFGVSPETRLPAEAYRPEVSVTVYAAIGEAAAAVLRQGHGAVADAVFEHLAERISIAKVAAGAGVAFDGLWLDAQPDVLVQRVSSRRGDPSDATPEVIMDQLRRSPAAIDWPRVRTDADRETVCATARRVICRPDPVAPA
jgi:hypothetical protein